MNAIEIIDKIQNHGMITHGGKFHADEVLSTALLQIVLEDTNLWPQRVFKVPENTMSLVYDVGFGEFDHHQENATVYENGKKKASFGLLCEQIIPYVYSQEVYKELSSFIMDIDEHDNYGLLERTQEPYPISVAIGAFNTRWDGNQDSDAAFKEAVQWSRTILERYIEKAQSKILAKEEVEKSKREDGILFLERYLPWQDLIEDEIKYVVYPSMRGGYNIQVNPNIDIDLPASWLEQYPEGCLFVHQGLFLAQFESVDCIVQAIRG